MKTLILNGWAASKAAWSLCGFAKDEDSRILTYIEQLDGEAEKALDEAGKAIVVGWSMGGSSALRLAMTRPGKIKGLVLVAATARMMEANNWSGMSERRLKAFEAGFKLTGGEGLFGTPEGRPNPYERDTDERLARGLAYLKETDLRLGLIDLLSSGKAKFPVWIFQSEKDGIVRPENAKFLAAVFPQAKVEMISGTEHALPVAIPERIDAAVRSIG
ncbi:MAG: alpha/beta hydrolase [Kiritimatiellae bacterium]|nr:alpha/beta hydrolase [Kiritimatiellia bacterium]